MYENDVKVHLALEVLKSPAISKPLRDAAEKVLQNYLEH